MEGSGVERALPPTKPQVLGVQGPEEKKGQGGVLGAHARKTESQSLRVPSVKGRE